MAIQAKARELLNDKPPISLPYSIIKLHLKGGGLKSKSLHVLCFLYCNWVAFYILPLTSSTPQPTLLFFRGDGGLNFKTEE